MRAKSANETPSHAEQRKQHGKEKADGDRHQTSICQGARVHRLRHPAQVLYGAGGSHLKAGNLTCCWSVLKQEPMQIGPIKM
jgi:hypothetical protein